ncbi:EAL domain-containing protein [Terasakiella sp. SH-1]|uniref:EAL domain-containing protein n=1 Tax=Terasakiella sp. SH-1 TaxID=2560057 RepID=UPI0010749D4D|nr:EAL domain-containing protein [Terasakiella sp. SH-1]
MEENFLYDAAPAILEASSEAIITIDYDGKIKGCNNQFLFLLGIKTENDLPQNIDGLFPDFDFENLKPNSADVFEPTKLTKPSGTNSLVLMKVIPIGLHTNSFKTILIQDPETIRRIIDHLDYIDSFDVASGLLNRNKATLEFEQLQASNLSGGCFLIKTSIGGELDNEDQRYGEILKQVSVHLKPLSSQSVICRYSLDELLFVSVNEKPLDTTALQTAIEAIKNDPYLTPDIHFSLSYQEWSGTKEPVGSLLSALRQRLDDINATDLFDAVAHKSTKGSRSAFLHKLEKALENDELHFFIQPQLSSENRHVAGGELLIRWMPSDNEVIPPSQFVDYLEHGEFGKTFLNWSIKRSAEILTYLKKELGTYVPISLNVASNYFSEETLVQPLEQCMTQYGIPFENLEIEITERVLAENPKEVMKTLSNLREKGFPAAIDDFGTGYSSLSYLRKFPLDRLKIDRVFVTNLQENEEDRLIAVAIASLAHVLGLEIVAEGVETNTQAAFLKNIGCEYFQGYLTGKPMSVKDFVEFYRENEKQLDEDSWSTDYIADTKVGTKHRKVTWKKSFSTDVVSIDNEHRDLIELLNKAAETYNEDPEALDLGETFDLIGAETLRHFDHEENVMRNMGYPRYEMHKDKHKWLIADLAKRKAEILNNPESTNFEEVLHYLKYWLLRHLISEDTHILRYLNKSNTERRLP